MADGRDGAGDAPPAPSGVPADAARVAADAAWPAVDAGLPADERILRATMAALAALDPAALTIKQLCGAAGVTAPTLYYHFGNKDGLVAAAVERLVAEWMAAMDAAVSREGPLPATIEQAIAAWTVAITAPERPLAVFAWATLLLADTSELARRALLEARDRGRAMIAEVAELHVPAPLVAPIAGLLVDSVIASAVQYELDHDADALRARLDTLGLAVRLAAGNRPGEAGAPQ
jgi:AcrR family transcriptional regulator